MKDSMINMMVTMMPLMKPFMWIGAGIAMFGILLLLAKILFKSNTSRGVSFTAVIVFVVSAFFVMAQGAGYYLSMPPTVNFGDSSKFEFILVSFWQIGLAFFVVAILLKLLGGGSRRVLTT